MSYIIAAKFTHPIQRVIKESTSWIVLDIGIEICEQVYQSDSWQVPRILVIARNSK